MPLDECFYLGICVANEKWNLFGLEYALLTYFNAYLLHAHVL